MRYPIHRSAPIGAAITASVIATIIAAIGVLLSGYSAGATEPSLCSGVQINPGDDLDTIVNRDPYKEATTFCVHASSSGTTYLINNTIVLGPGDKLLGDPGQVVARGPATYGVPTVNIRNGASLPILIDLNGSNQLRWLDIAGAVAKYNDNGSVVQASGMAIRAGQANAATLMEYLNIHDTHAQGIVNMNGRLLHSNLYNNGTNPDFWGFTAAAVKGVDEYEAAYNYIHDNPANGLWCDHACSDVGAAMPNGFWAHHNLIVDNGRYGVHYEYSPIVASGVHASQPTALIENNEIHANGYKGGSGYAGAAMRDSQNATFRNNVFGPKTIAGVSYRANVNDRAIYFVDSGRASRTDLWNGKAVGNSLGGEAMVGCEKPDDVVDCTTAPADTTAPIATIDSKPAARTTDDTPSFGFSSDEASSSFECSLTTSASSFESCTSPKNYTAQPDGAYTFKVRATDAAGNTGDAASYSFEIDATDSAAPSVPDLETASDTGLSNTNDATSDATPSFSGTADAGSMVEILVDGTTEGSEVATDGSYSITVGQIALGSHSVQARATDPSGNGGRTSGVLGVQIVEATSCHTAINRITGTEASNGIEGTPAADLIVGLGGTDTLAGLAGADCLSGDAADDTLKGGRDDDELVGGGGHDRIVGELGRDIVRSGWGDDNIDAVDATAERIDCGVGSKDMAIVDRIDQVVGCETVSRK